MQVVNNLPTAEQLLRKFATFESDRFGSLDLVIGGTPVMNSLSNCAPNNN